MSGEVRERGGRARHRRRHRVPKTAGQLRWWHLVLALVVSAAGVVLAIHILDRPPPPPIDGF